jgi:hypothetical protein
MTPHGIPIIDFRQEELEDARRLTVSQKLALGGDLFDSACQVTLSGIFAQHPGIPRNQALDILRDRLERARENETRI